ncbi:MAG: hypothetical protein BWY52_00685 [Chloroflexi bacterium ADurb.Bin325]|nr:MAG: hypothetical protein BWY52_00685 [Chloroflexi bacterium ADurb.Bin325]
MAIEQRWAILEALYRTKGVAPQTLYDDELAAQLNTSWSRLREEVDYLAQRGFLTLANPQRGSLIYTRMHLSAAGVDIIEGRTEDAAVPPPDALTGMAPDAQPWTRSAIRQLLHDAFGDEELTTFCFDNFPSVHADFTLGMSLGQKIQLLLEYAVRHRAVDALLAAVQQANPEQYARYEAALRPQG